MVSGCIWGWVKTYYYILLSILMGWTSIYQLFWGSLGARVLTNSHLVSAKYRKKKTSPGPRADPGRLEEQQADAEAGRTWSRISARLVLRWSCWQLWRFIELFEWLLVRSCIASEYHHFGVGKSFVDWPWSSIFIAMLNYQKVHVLFSAPPIAVKYNGFR